MFRSLLSDYWRRTAPELFASDEALGFAKYLEEKCLQIPFLKEVLAFEKAVLLSVIQQRKGMITCNYDLFTVLDSLRDRKKPVSPKNGLFKVEISLDKIEMHSF